MNSDVQSVLGQIESQKVTFVRLWFSDVLGRLKSVAISPVELERAFSEGARFDGSAIDGFSRVQESDVLAVPDATTFVLLPSRGDSVGIAGSADISGEPRTARMFCRIVNLDGDPFPGDPRQVLERSTTKARELGYEFFCSPEVEFFYFDQASTSRSTSRNLSGRLPEESWGSPRPIDSSTYFDLTADDVSGRLRQRSLLVLEEMGIPVEYSFHEDAPGQNEIDLRYTDALSMADMVMTMRYVVKQVAAQENVLASFMPKPLGGVQGSGMHTHLSLFEGDRNAFFDANAEHRLSKVAESFVAGLLRHAPEITAVTNQLVNSYKRLASGKEAPNYVAWARNNRSALVRVPVVRKDKINGARVEYRALDSAANPYLAFAAILGAGLAGVAGEYELPDEAHDNLAELDFAPVADNKLRSLQLRSLPQSLNEALAEMERSELMAEILGDHIFEWFIRNKRDEWARHQSHVSEFELRENLRW